MAIVELISAGATPLELAARQDGHSQVMATLIEPSGADEDSRLENGLTSLCLAEVHGRLDAMKLQNCAFETLPLCAGAHGWWLFEGGARADPAGRDQRMCRLKRRSDGPLWDRSES